LIEELLMRIEAKGESRSTRPTRRRLPVRALVLLVAIATSSPGGAAIATAAGKVGSIAIEIAPVSQARPAPLLRAMTRGDLSSILRFPIPRAQRALSVTVPHLDLPADAIVRVELEDADGNVMAASTYRQQEFSPRTTVTMRRRGRAWAPGRYTLRLIENLAAPTAAGPRDAADFGFVVAAPPR
jgi:hypothetical protein